MPRAYRRDIRRPSGRLQALNPVVGLPLLAGLAKLIGGGGAKAVVGVAAAVAIAATGGIVVLQSAVHEPGDPAPFRLLSIRDSQGRPVTRGAPVPEGFTIVSARIRLPAGPSTLPRDPRGPFPSVTLPCPKGMKYTGYQTPGRELPLRALQPSNDSIPGYATSAQIEIGHAGLRRPLVFTVGIACRRPDANGSTAVTPRKLKPGERLGHVCTDRNGVNLRSSPGGRRRGSRSAAAIVRCGPGAGTLLPAQLAFQLSIARMSCS